jgi:hypothetical protein
MIDAETTMRLYAMIVGNNRVGAGFAGYIFKFVAFRMAPVRVVK